MADAPGRREINRQRTKQDIENAFLSEYAEGGIEDVNISRICKACGISRSAFYLYYEDKYAILQGAEERLLAALWEICRVLPDRAEPDSVTENALRTLAHIRENLGWYAALLGVHGDPMFVYRWKKDIVKSLERKLAARNYSREEAELRGVLFSSALIGLYTHIVQECPELPDALAAKYMDRLLFMLLN